MAESFHYRHLGLWRFSTLQNFSGFFALPLTLVISINLYIVYNNTFIQTLCAFVHLNTYISFLRLALLSLFQLYVHVYHLIHCSQYKHLVKRPDLESDFYLFFLVYQPTGAWIICRLWFYTDKMLLCCFLNVCWISKNISL